MAPMESLEVGNEMSQRWHSPWYYFCGSCSPNDCTACCTAYWVPCVAYGYVSSRLFRTSFWRETGKFLLVFGIVAILSLIAAVGQVLTCPIDPAALSPDSPAPPKPLEASGSCLAWYLIGRGMQMGTIACAVVWALHIGGPHRTKIRKLLGIADSGVGGDCCTCCHRGPDKGSSNDCCLHYWCLCCALAQEMRTVMHFEAVKAQREGVAPEGYEPLITRAPVVGGGMSRVVGVPVPAQGDALV